MSGTGEANNGEGISDLNKKEIAELHAKATGLESYKALVDKEKETIATQNEQISQLSAQVKTQQNREKENNDKRDAAKKRVDDLKGDLEAARVAAQVSVKSYGGFVRDRGALQGDVNKRTTLLQRAADMSAADRRVADLTETFDVCINWTSFEDTAKAKITELEAAAQRFDKEGADVKDVTELKSSFEKLQQLVLQKAPTVLREKHRRADYQDNLTRFKSNHAQVVQWCRQQRASLDALVDPQQVQQFCTSFQNNIGIMETNFVVLMEMSEGLVPNADVEKLIVEAVEVWLGLEIFAYEKLQTTLMGLHQTSNLEKEGKLWTEYSIRLKKFLQDAEQLLEMPTDEESRKHTSTALETCKGLLNDHDAHLIIVEHLSDYSLREECIKEHYSAARRTVFSKLTLLTQTFHGQYNYERKQEYTDRMAELSDWVECKSQSNAWRDLLGRVERMRSLIEESEATHNPHDDRTGGVN